MYLLNLPHVLANMHRYVRQTLQLKPDPGELKRDFVRALVQSQGHALSVAPRPVLGFDERPIYRGEAPFARGYGAVRRLTEPERERVRARVDGAFALLERLDRRLLDLVCLLLTDIIAVKAERGGAITASWMMGALSLLPLEEWDEARYAENLVHESVHTGLHLAERIYPLYREPDRLKDPEARVPSAIREGQLRPLDGALHSACVAVAVAYLHYLRGDDDAVIRRLRQLVDCVQGLATRRHLLTDYANALVSELRDFMARPDFDALGQGLQDPAWMLFPPPGGSANREQK